MIDEKLHDHLKSPDGYRINNPGILVSLSTDKKEVFFTLIDRDGEYFTFCFEKEWFGFFANQTIDIFESNILPYCSEEEVLKINDLSKTVKKKVYRE